MAAKDRKAAPITIIHRTAAHQFYERRGFEKRAFLFSKVLR